MVSGLVFGLLFCFPVDSPCPAALIRGSMMLHQVVQWGPPLDPHDAESPLSVTLSGVAKVNLPSAPYVVANEAIGTALAQHLGLPVPPGVVVRATGGGVAYVSLRFGSLVEVPPPVLIDVALELRPFLVGATIAFDCWIMNFDRHERNVAFQEDGLPFTIFDHGNGLFGKGPSAEAWLEHSRQQAETDSCLVEAMVADLITPDARATLIASLQTWQWRITTIPAHVIIESIERAASECGVPGADAQRLVIALDWRRKNLDRLLRSQLPYYADPGVL